MAKLILFFGRKLGEGFLQGREVEDRIVPKATAALWSFQNFAVRTAGYYRKRASFARECNGTNKMRGTLVGNFFAQLVQQF